MNRRSVLLAAYLFLGVATGSHLQAQQIPVTTITVAVTSDGAAVSSVASGSVVSLTATVNAGATTVTTGEVNFCDDTAPLCTDIQLLGVAQLTSAGSAGIKFIPGIGSHNYKAVFAGTSDYAPSSSSPAALDVTGLYPTTTSITSSGNPGSYTLTVTVSTAGTLTAGETVSFLDTSNANQSLGTASLGAGTPALNFVNSSNPATGSSPSSLAVGDFNNDGVPDLAIANFVDGGPITVLLGKGDGTFTSTSVATGSGGAPCRVVVGDFNGDGKQDIAALNCDGISRSVTILLGNGDGTFTPTAASPSTGYDPNSIAVGDFNGDGKLDLAIVNELSPVVIEILLGNGDGTFTPAAASSALPYLPGTILVGDFNGDGKADLVVSCASDGSLMIFLGNGDGTFTQTAVSPTTGPDPDAIAVGDFNGDGILDLAVTTGDTNGNDTLTVLLGNGDGTFTPVASNLSTGVEPQTIAVGDFNGDGKADLAVANFGSDTLTVLLGNGDGTFTPAATSPATGLSPYAAVAADFNGDGKADLVAANNVGSNVTVLLAQASETAIATATGISPVGTGTHQVEASYPGDGNNRASISGTVGLTAMTPSFTVSGTGITIAAGATVGNTSTITVTPAGGFSGSVVLTAVITANPAGAQDLPTLSFGSTSPVSIAVANTGIATLTVSTAAATRAALARPKRGGIPRYLPVSATLACILFFGIPTRRPRRLTMLGRLAILIILAGGILACGGGGSTGNPGTTAGTYTVTVTGTSGSITAVGPITLIVR